MADLKAGTTVAGAAIWNASNLQVIPAGNFLTYRGFKVYTSGDKPTATDLGFLPAAGGAMTGALTSNSNITSSKIIEGQETRTSYRAAIYRSGGTPYMDFIRTDISSADAPPTTTQTLGLLRFGEASKTSDIHAGVNRAQLQSLVLNDGSSRLQLDNRDSAGVVTNSILMDSANGLTHVNTGTFRVSGATTLGTVSTDALTASSATVTGTITGNGSLTLNSPNAGIELGSLSTAGTPFIDFHTSGTNVDYNVRLIVNSSSISITTPGVTLADFNMKYTQNIRMHTTAACGIYMSRNALVLRDHYNGNVSLSAAKKSDADTVGGDLYLGFTNANMNAYTNKIRLESEMNWKGTNSLVDANGKLVGASLDTAYLPLTGGTMSNNITIAKSGVGALTFKNTTIDTTVALPSSNQYIGIVNFYEDRAGVEKIRSRLESIILPSGHTMTSLYVRDSADSTKANIRLESETGLVNIVNGNFRCAGTTTLVGNVIASNTLTVVGQIKADNLALGGDIVSDIGALTVNGNIVTRLGSITARTSIYSNGDGNSHLWFMNGAGQEKAVIFADGLKKLNIRTNDRNTVQNWEFGNTGMIFAKQAVYGEDQAVIRSEVEGGGHADWRARASGLQIDCPQANTSAYNVWKATKWGSAHIAAMDVHRPNDNDSGAIVRLLVAGQAYKFFGEGTFDSPGNINANDVYIRSDERLKRNFVKLDSALDKVEQLNGYTYEKKMTLESDEYNKQEAGLIAQELRKVLPEAVSENTETSVLTISPSAVNALLVEAIKELRQEVKELKSKIKGA